MRAAFIILETIDILFVGDERFDDWDIINANYPSTTGGNMNMHSKLQYSDNVYLTYIKYKITMFQKEYRPNIDKNKIVT